MRMTREERIADAKVVAESAKEFANTLDEDQKKLFIEFVRQVLIWGNKIDEDLCAHINSGIAYSRNRMEELRCLQEIERMTTKEENND